MELVFYSYTFKSKKNHNCYACNKFNYYPQKMAWILYFL